MLNRSDDTDIGHSYFGRKYVGVGTGGTLEVHGAKKLSWTFLNKTLHPGEANENSYHFEKGWGNRGIIVHVIDPSTGQVLHNDRWVQSEAEKPCLSESRSEKSPVLHLVTGCLWCGQTQIEDEVKEHCYPHS